MEFAEPTHRLDAASVDPGALFEREWLLTNGTGAFAMGTAAGCNTRRYHGLLVAAAHPPVERVVALSQVLEELVVRHPAAGGDGAGRGAEASEPRTLAFGACRFRGDAGEPVDAPAGWRMLERFERGLSVTWRYRDAGTGVGLTRTLRLHWKQQAATLSYRLTGLPPGRSAATLRLRPLVALRDFHALGRRTDGPPFDLEAQRESITATHGGHRMTVACPGGHFIADPDWWYGLWYPVETHRGQDDLEDLHSPGLFQVPLPEDTDEPAVELVVSFGAAPAEPCHDDAARARVLAPIAEHLAAPRPGVSPQTHALGGEPIDPGDAKPLAIAASDFVVDRTVGGEALSTIIAGYPWFADWGRDTFIALPGLLLDTGRHDEAQRVLRAFAGAIKHGLVPNRFDDYDDQAAHYNTVDASLWFIHAAMQYAEASGDAESWDTWLADACAAIVDAYIEGTGDLDTAVCRDGARPGHGEPLGDPAPQDAPPPETAGPGAAGDGDAPAEADAAPTAGSGAPGRGSLIFMDSDALIVAGTPQTQLTWMDAAAGGVVFTPRPGKAVEINALWHHVLTGLAERLPDRHADRKDHYGKLAGRVRRSFARVFWDDERRCLIDHVYTDDAGNEVRDTSLRPNQVFAASLARSPMPATRLKQMLRTVRDELLTPAGLRTLPPGDPAYHGRYGGDQFHRDEAYHQGTVWSWLIGPYAEAVLRLGKFSDAAKAEARAAMQPLLDRLRAQGLGQLHEVFDGDPDDAGRHAPRGCIAQAWTVAELIRVLRMTGSGDAPAADPAD